MANFFVLEFHTFRGRFYAGLLLAAGCLKFACSPEPVTQLTCLGAALVRTGAPWGTLNTSRPSCARGSPKKFDNADRASPKRAKVIFFRRLTNSSRSVGYYPLVRESYFGPQQSLLRTSRTQQQQQLYR